MSEPAEYSVRAYAPGDEAAIQRAFSGVFGVERSLAEWRWKFLAPPRGSRILLAFDGAGELVCQYAAIAVDVAVGAPKRAAQIVDVFSRRRRGLGSARRRLPAHHGAVPRRMRRDRSGRRFRLRIPRRAASARRLGHRTQQYT